MAYRDDGGFGSGMGGGFGTSGYDPRRQWEGPLVTRGVNRDGSRVPRQHDDERPSYPQPHPQYQQGFHREHGGFSNYAGGGDRDRSSYGRPEHFSELAAQRAQGFHGHEQQHGYGQSQYPDETRWGYGSSGTDMGLGERGPHYGKGPKGYKRSDERIREEVCEVMSRQGHIDASDVEITVEAGVVRLVGTVAGRNEKRGLEMMADRVHGVEEVRNELRLRRPDATQQQQPVSNRAPVSTQGSGTGANGKNVHS